MTISGKDLPRGCIDDPEGSKVPSLTLAPDAFGDPFQLADLPLARPASGYALQRLDTDTLLDKHSGHFLAVRNPALSGLFTSFGEAFAAGQQWMENNPSLADSHPIAIVPAHFDHQSNRHVLNYGVLTQSP